MTQTDMLADILQKQIIIHWWNFRTKTLDFKGNLEDCLKAKGITWSFNSETSTYIFETIIGRGKIQLEDVDFENTAFTILKMYHVYLGGKTQIKLGYRDQKINWR